jgi:predicted NUDIX family NTP pyrophosphohydrolase
MSKISAGLILYRIRNEKVEVLLVHLGGPFWRNKDDGAWFIPKGELEKGEEPLAGAKREFEEETGLTPQGNFLELGTVKQKSGKTIYAWAFESDCDPEAIKSNTFTMEWPPKSGHQREFPEIDRAAFFTVGQAKPKIHPAEFPLLLRLQALLKHA